MENGCHDNPTLDVTNDSQPEMRQKKPSANGLAGGGEGGGEDGNRWQVMGKLVDGGTNPINWQQPETSCIDFFFPQVFVNQAATEEEEEEQDTHL